MSDEFWTLEEDAEFVQAELDDAAASQAAEDQFPDGWTDVSATEEPISLGKGIVIGPAEIYMAPVESPVFEAIDRASEDRTPVLDVLAPSARSSWIQFRETLERSLLGYFAEHSGPKTAEVTAKPDLTSFSEALATATEAMGKFGQVVRSVALMGTGYRRHASPGDRRAGETRAEHARRRRLYSQRLQRDRRRRRAGRAPLLRSSAFQALIPHAQVDARKAGPEALGMEIVLSAAVPDDQVYIVDNSVLDQFVQPYELQPPKFFDESARSWRRSLLYGMQDAGITGQMHRATNYLIQADEHARRDLDLPSGVRPSRVWVDDVEVDVDRWLNEGGADRG